MTRFERLLSTRPAYKPFRLWRLELLYDNILVHIYEYLEICASPNSDCGRLPKYEEYDRRCLLSSTKLGARSRTTMIPSEDGPNASSRTENGTDSNVQSGYCGVYCDAGTRPNLPARNSARLTDTGDVELEGSSLSLTGIVVWNERYSRLRALNYRTLAE